MCKERKHLPMSSGDKGPSHRARNCSISSRNLGHTNKARSMTSSTSGHAGHSALRHTPISSGSCESSLLGEHSGEMKGDEHMWWCGRFTSLPCYIPSALPVFILVFIALYIFSSCIIIISHYMQVHNHSQFKKTYRTTFFKQVTRRCVGSVEYKRTSPFTGHHDNIRIHFLKELQFEFIDQF